MSAPLLTPFRLALAIALITAATLIGAWIFQALGYAPCELCLKERIPYYAGFALAAAIAAPALLRSSDRWLSAGFALLALLFAGGAVFGAYHAGVEFGLWPGPADCTGVLAKADSVGDFLKQLQTVKVVRCDAVAIRVLGLSLAVWNAVIAAALAGLAALGFALSRRPPAAPVRAAFPFRS